MGLSYSLDILSDVICICEYYWFLHVYFISCSLAELFCFFNFFIDFLGFSILSASGHLQIGFVFFFSNSYFFMFLVVFCILISIINMSRKKVRVVIVSLPLYF